MANDYNPNSPSSVGLEWLTDQYGEYALGAWAQRIRSRTAETINRLDVFLHPAALGLDVSLLQADIMPAGQEVPSGTVTAATYQPDADVTVTNWSRSGGGSPLYTAIDEGVSAVSVADYVVSTNAASSSYTFHVASNGFSGTARVLNVQVRAVIASTSGGSTMYIGMRSTGGGFNGRQVACNTTPTTVTVEFGEIRPQSSPSALWRPFTFTDIRGLDTVGNLLAVEFQTLNSPANVTVYACEVIVTYQTVENRVAAATYLKSPLLFNAPPDNYTFNSFGNQSFISLPAGGASWSKPASGDFTVLLRPPNNPLGPAPPTTFALNWTASLLGSSYQNCSVPGVLSALPTLDSYGQVTAVDFTDNPVQQARTAAVILRTTAPAVSSDSLPYVLATGDGINHFPDINNGQTVEQQFTAPASTAYKFAKFLVDPGVATDDLNVRVRRVSDDLQFGSTEAVAVVDVQAESPDANSLRLTTVTFATPATLVNGTRYYLELTSTDSTPGGLGWRTVLPGHVNTGAGIATFDGTTNTAVVGGSTLADYDVPFRLLTPPTGPAGTPTAVASSTVNNVFAPVQNCVPSAIQAITLTWSATALGVDFDHYDVQRRPVFGDDGDWQIIAVVTEEATTTFVDYETARGVPYEYRVRVVRTDSAESAWTTASSGATAASLDCEISFTSNENPDLNCAFVRNPEQDYVFQSAARDELIQIFGSNNSVAFMESEDAGIQVGAILTVNFGRAPTVGDVQIYDPLRRISRAPLSYVCVLDHVGNRFYAHVQFGAARWEEPGYRYHADVVITEVTQTSSIAVL